MPRHHGSVQSTKFRGYLCCLFALLSLLPSVAQAQNFVWVRQFGTDSEDQVNAVAVGASGIYVGGSSVGFFPGQTNGGQEDALVARYDQAGNQLWARQFGSTTVIDDFVFGVAADSTGVYAVGPVLGTLPGQTTAGSSDVVVRKYDVNGTELWTRQFGTNAEDKGWAAAVDATGVYVVGSLFGDAFVRKYDLNGNQLWHRLIDTTSADEARGVAVDSSGVYVVGRTNGELAAPAVGGLDVFLRKFDANGNVIWTRQFGSNTTDQGNAVAVNSTGVYVAGDTTGAFPGQTKVGGLWDEFAAKYDLNGNQQWVRQFGTRFEDAAFGVALSASGAYFVGMSDGEPLPGATSVGNWDAYVRVYDVNGAVLSTRMFGTTGNEEAYGVAADSTGVYIGGYTRGAFTGQTNLGQTDGFIARILPPPDVNVGGVVNNATFEANPAPLAPGSIAAVFGTNLNDGTIHFSSSFGPDGKLVTTLGGASATVNGTPAPIFYSTLAQMGIQIPNEVAGQSSAQIVVTVAGQSSVARSFNIAPAAAGFFTLDQRGTGTASVVHGDGSGSVSAGNPARPNEVVIFFLTGLGALNPALATGEPSGVNPTAATAILTVDGTPAEIIYAGGSPGLVGLNQLNARIPAGTRRGADIPVRLTIAGRQSNAVTIPVGP